MTQESSITLDAPAKNGAQVQTTVASGQLEDFIRDAVANGCELVETKRQDDRVVLTFIVPPSSGFGG